MMFDEAALGEAMRLRRRDEQRGRRRPINRVYGPPAKPFPAKWTDEAILEALHLMDHEGLTAAETGRRFGVTKNAILGLRYRARHESERHFGEAGDGTMPPGWWRRA